MKWRVRNLRINSRVNFFRYNIRHCGRTVIYCKIFVTLREFVLYFVVRKNNKYICVAWKKSWFYYGPVEYDIQSRNIVCSPARLSLTHQHSESESCLTLARVCARVTNTWVTSIENTSCGSQVSSGTEVSNGTDAST